MRNFTDIKIGEKDSISKVITEEDVVLFSRLSGDVNLIHLDEEFARKSPFKRRIAPGLLTSSLISAVLGTKLPGVMIRGMEVLMDVDDEGSDCTPKELIYEEDKMKLYHYKPLTKNTCKVPTLIVYALVNRQYMMDIQQDKSVIKNLLEQGLDLYIIDWGYPTPEDRYLTMEDYIEGYIHNTVDFICKANKVEKINIMGVCQGGTFSAW